MCSARSPVCDVTPCKNRPKAALMSSRSDSSSTPQVLYVTCLGGNRRAMLCLDDFTCFKIIHFLEHKSDAAKSFANSSRDTSPPQASRSAPSAPVEEESSRANFNRS